MGKTLIPPKMLHKRQCEYSEKSEIKNEFSEVWENWENWENKNQQIVETKRGLLTKFTLRNYESLTNMLRK